MFMLCLPCLYFHNSLVSCVQLKNHQFNQNFLGLASFDKINRAHKINNTASYAKFYIFSTCSIKIWKLSWLFRLTEIPVANIYCSVLNNWPLLINVQGDIQGIITQHFWQYKHHFLFRLLLRIRHPVKISTP